MKSSLGLIVATALLREISLGIIFQKQAMEVAQFLSEGLRGDPRFEGYLGWDMMLETKGRTCHCK